MTPNRNAGGQWVDVSVGLIWCFLSCWFFSGAKQAQLWLGSTFIGLSFQNRVFVREQVRASLVTEDLPCVGSCQWCSIQIIHYLQHLILRHHENLSLGCVLAAGWSACRCWQRRRPKWNQEGWELEAGKNICQLESDMMLTLSLRQAYRSLALLVHPDKCAAQSAGEAAKFLCSSEFEGWKLQLTWGHGQTQQGFLHPGWSWREAEGPSP